jgi:hypothetical protein
MKKPCCKACSKLGLWGKTRAKERLRFTLPRKVCQHLSTFDQQKFVVYPKRGPTVTNVRI